MAHPQERARIRSLPSESGGACGDAAVLLNGDVMPCKAIFGLNVESMSAAYISRLVDPLS